MSRIWKREELSLLHEVWASRRRIPIAEVEAMFPGRSYRAICSKAWSLGLGSPKLSPGEGNRVVMEALGKRKMTTAQLARETGYSLDVLRGILGALRDAGSIHIAEKIAPPRGGHALNVWAAVGSPDAPETIVEQLRPLAGNPFAQLLL